MGKLLSAQCILFCILLPEQEVILSVHKECDTADKQEQDQSPTIWFLEKGNYTKEPTDHYWYQRTNNTVLEHRTPPVLK